MSGLLPPLLAAGLASVFLLCSGDGQNCPPERWLGEYAVAGEVNGRLSYRHQDGESWFSAASFAKEDVRAKQLAGDALLLQPLMWNVPKLGWFVGAAEHLGDRRGSIFARDPEATTPNAVTSVWTTALGTANGSLALPSLRCLNEAEGRTAVAAAVEAKRAALAKGAGTVYFAPVPSSQPKIDRLRASWVGAYRRLRLPGGPQSQYWIVNDRFVYERLSPTGAAAGGKSARALWFAGDSWFIGYKEHAGQPRGIFHARDTAVLPETIVAPWLVAGAAAAKPRPQGTGLQAGTGPDDWVVAGDLALTAGEAGKQALLRFKAEQALRAGAAGRRMGLGAKGGARADAAGGAAGMPSQTKQLRRRRASGWRGTGGGGSGGSETPERTLVM
jgi:hypothetical protein